MSVRAGKHSVASSTTLNLDCLLSAYDPLALRRHPSSSFLVEFPHCQAVCVSTDRVFPAGRLALYLSRLRLPLAARRGVHVDVCMFAVRASLRV